MKKFILTGTLSVLVIAAMAAPFALIKLYRSSDKKKPRIHLIQNMDNQAFYKTQDYNKAFKDNRAMRPRVDGTVARGELAKSKPVRTGAVEDSWLNVIPSEYELDDEFIKQGKNQYRIFCLPCHGPVGLGDGPVAQRAKFLQEKNWIVPTSLQSTDVKNREAGHVFNTITNGIRNMPAYKSQVDVDDRWAIVAFIKSGELESAPQSKSENDQ